jgi:uncharacterized protein (DUF1697 family)
LPTYISLLRGINVSGQKKIRMQDLRECYHGMGFRNVRTYIQSGNVVFESEGTNIEDVKSRIEEGLKRRFGFDVNVVMRSRQDWQRLIASPLFSDIKAKEPSKLYVVFFSKPIGGIPELDAFEQVRADSETFRFGRTEIYLHLPQGAARTKLSGNFIEKHLNIPVTARNWKTVTALYGLLTE